MSIIEKLKATIIPSAFAAAAGTGIYYAFVDDDLTSKIAVAGMAVPIGAVVAGTIFLGNSLGDIVTEFVVPHLPESGELKKIQDIALPPAMAGIATYAVMTTLVSDQTSLKNSLLIGAGGSVIGQYAYSYMN